jgi:hypothetical protein
VRKAAPQDVGIVGLIHSQRLAAGALNPRWPQESELAFSSTFGVEHLNAGEVGAQNSPRCVEYLLVQSLDAAGIAHYRGKLLKALGGIELHREGLRASSQCLVGLFQRARSLPDATVQLCFHVVLRRKYTSFSV